MKILLVDDEKIGRDSLQALLSTCNFEVETAADGPQALDIAKRFLPDVVVIDWMLGQQMDGLGLANALHESQPSARIVIISGHSDVRNSAPPDAPYGFLMKPFQLAELLGLFGDEEGHI